MSSLKIFVKTFFSLVLTWSLFGLPVTLLSTTGVSNTLESNAGTQYARAAVYDALPLNFELNQGQTNRRVKFIARSQGYVLFLTPTEAVMALDNPSAQRRGKENLEVRDGKNDFMPGNEKGRPPRS